MRGSRTEADRALTKLLVQVDEGTVVEPTRQTVGDFLTEWLDSHRSKVRPSTLVGYRAKIDQYVRPAIGTVRLQQLTSARLNAFYAELLEGGRKRGTGGLSARTVRYVHTIIRKALSDALRWGRVQRNVADQADPPKHRTPEMRTWSAEQLRTFLAHVREDRMYACWLLLATTGLRRGEAAGVKWDDLDLDAGRLAVRRALVMVGSHAEFSAPKTAKGRRSVALDRATVAVLREHRKRQAEERLALGGAYQDGGLVFCREDGTPLDPDRLTKAFDGHVQAAGLPRIRLHDLRHTFASLALQAGVHVKVVSERLGHSNIAITLDTYSHSIPAMEPEAAERVAGLILGGSVR